MSNAGCGCDIFICMNAWINCISNWLVPVLIFVPLIFVLAVQAQKQPEQKHLGYWTECSLYIKIPQRHKTIMKKLISILFLIFCFNFWLQTCTKQNPLCHFFVINVLIKLHCLVQLNSFFWSDTPWKWQIREMWPPKSNTDEIQFVDGDI